jgi:hypothetical protein
MVYSRIDRSRIFPLGKVKLNFANNVIRLPGEYQLRVCTVVLARSGQFSVRHWQLLLEAAAPVRVQPFLILTPDQELA